MAGDWIPVRTNLKEDPAVIGIAALIGHDEFFVIGRLNALWGWANEQTESGVVPHVNAEWIDRFVGCQGFAHAMQSVGWLSIRTGAVEIPKFDRWNSNSAKARLGEAVRKRIQRKKPGEELSGQNSGPEKRREEERRDKGPPPKPPPGGGSGFEKFWELYPKKAAKQAALKAWGQLRPSPELQEVITQALMRQRMWPKWAEEGGRYIPHASTWLNGRRWEDKELVVERNGQHGQTLFTGMREFLEEPHDSR